MSDPAIRYVHGKEIDRTKWDRCIENAPNGLIYSYSFYLDQMAKNWDGLVLNDYEAVMPLTWNNKYGIRYLYQPFLTAQLGVFGQGLTGKTIHDFIEAIPNSFRLVEIPLNYGNTDGIPAGLSRSRKNYTLLLGKPYEELYSGNNENTRRNIKKAAQTGCTATKNIPVENVIDLAVQHMKSYSRESAENLENFRKLYQQLDEKKMTAVYGIESAEKTLLASCIFFFSHNRAYYILVGNHPSSRATGASHALIDTFIKDHAGKNILLDFEGSDIPTLASFYSGFGAMNEPYPFLKINRLPFYMKWMKK
ncbi:MAG: hypothetical protein ABIR30_01715 [Chitinophagaceae bacterium]